MAHIFGQLLTAVNVVNQFWQNTGWASFWSILPQIHLVALFSGENVLFTARRLFEAED
jgi:hypothetical protein